MMMMRLSRCRQVVREVGEGADLQMKQLTDVHVNVIEALELKGAFVGEDWSL